MRKIGLLVASLLFLSFGGFANEDGQGQGPGTKEQGIEKGEKGTGGDGLIATGDKNKKKEEKKKPTTPPPANK